MDDARWATVAASVSKDSGRPTQPRSGRPEKRVYALLLEQGIDQSLIGC